MCEQLVFFYNFMTELLRKRRICQEKQYSKKIVVKDLRNGLFLGKNPDADLL